MRFVSLALLALPLAACTASDPASQLQATDALVTGSVVAANRANGIDPKDAEIIKARVVSSPTTAFVAPLRWSNEETGASGAITAISAYKGRHGQPCRSFRTSIANFLGVSLFDGETCEVQRRSWILSWLKRSD